MPVTAPNTLGVAQAIQSLAQSLTITPINGISGYKTVSIGATKDVTDILPLLEITGADDETERDAMAAVGNTVEINDEQWLQLMTTVDYTDSGIAEQVVFALRDALTKALHTTAKLGGGVPGIIGVYVEKPGKYGYTLRNGVQCRIHQIRVRVTFWYEPTMGV